MDHDIEDDSKSEDNEAGEQSGRSDSPLTSSGTGARSQRAESEATDEDSEEVLDPREKFLIFTMGSRTYTPHQIGLFYSVFLEPGTFNNYVFYSGLKRITPFTFCNRIDVGPSLAERVAIQRQERQALEESLALGIPP